MIYREKVQSLQPNDGLYAILTQASPASNGLRGEPLEILVGLPGHAAILTAGTLHVPLIIVGSVSFGQYIRSIRMNLPAGAGSQLLSLSGPGLSFWMYRSVEPSGLAFTFCRG